MPRETVLKKFDVESDPLSQQIYVSLTKIRDQTPPGAGFEHSQAAGNGKACFARYATRLPLIQKNEIRRELLGQKNVAALASISTPYI